MRPTESPETQGIEGYREFLSPWEPGFRALIPSNWPLQESALEHAPGHWIALRGPLNEARTRFATLDILVIQRGSQAEFASLEAYSLYLVQQEGIGQPEVTLDRPIVLGPNQGREARIAYVQTIPNRVPVVTVNVIKEWTILEKNGYFVVILYGSSQEDFDKYIAAYHQLRQSFSWNGQ